MSKAIFSFTTALEWVLGFGFFYFPAIQTAVSRIINNTIAGTSLVRVVGHEAEVVPVVTSTGCITRVNRVVDKAGEASGCTICPSEHASGVLQHQI